MVRGAQSKNDSTEIDDLFRLTTSDWFLIKSLRTVEKQFSTMSGSTLVCNLPQRISTGWLYANGDGTRCKTFLLDMRIR